MPCQNPRKLEIAETLTFLFINLFHAIYLYFFRMTNTMLKQFTKFQNQKGANKNFKEINAYIKINEHLIEKQY